MAKSKSRFVYQERDPEETRKIGRESGKKYEIPFKSGFDIFTPKTENTNTIRILPPTWPNARHYGYVVYLHRFVGAASSTFLCLQQMGKGRCPCCEAWKKAKESGDEQESRNWNYSVQMVYWIIDRNGDDDLPMIYTISKPRDSEIIELSEDPQTRKLLKIDEPFSGYDISFKRTGTKKTDTKYLGTRVAQRPSPIHPDEETQEKILDYITEHPIPSILLFRDYNYINAAISGTTEEKDDDLDVAAEEEAAWDVPKAKPAPKARAAREEDEEEDEDEETPTRTAKSRRDEPEEDEDEAPARTPKKVAKAAPIEEEEEEDLPQARKPARTERMARTR